MVGMVINLRVGGFIYDISYKDSHIKGGDDHLMDGSSRDQSPIQEDAMELIQQAECLGCQVQSSSSQVGAEPGTKWGNCTYLLSNKIFKVVGQLHFSPLLHKTSDSL